MSQFSNVSVTKEANQYFDGQVTSRTLTFADGSTKTLGIMSVGNYEFATAAAELMEITAGKIEVQLEENGAWILYEGGSEFNVAAHSKFRVKALTLVDYCCSYL